MNEEQIERIQKIVQEIATDESITFDQAFAGAMGLLKEHADCMPKGKPSAGGGSTQSSKSQACQS
jgi:hypothetical protein